jgi:hypothetical protein
MLESSMVQYGGKIISVSKGKPASVEFDFEAVWRFKKVLGHRFDPCLLRWIHVHPTGFGILPSPQDELCAEGLAAAFKSCENFVILRFFNPGFQDIFGDLAIYRWDLKKLVLTETSSVEFGLFKRYAYILKTLSYGDLWTSGSMDSERLGAISLSS